MLNNGEINFLITDERYDDYSSFNSELLESSSLMVGVNPDSIPADEKAIDIKDLSSFKCVVIADKEYQLQEKEYFSKLLNFHGSFSVAKDIADSVTYIVDSWVPSFLPLSTKSCATKFYNSYTKILPLLKNNEPIIVDYKIYWSKDNEKLAAIAQKLIQLLKEKE